MIMVCISSAPNVDLAVFIPVAMKTAGWAWGTHPRFAGVLASEYAYSAHEAVSLVRAYSTTLARLIRPNEAERFSVVLRGRVTDMVVARDEWSWQAELHAFRPCTEPWDTWREAAREYWKRTGTLMDGQRFRAKVA